MNMSKIYRTIAKNHGVSEREIEQEICRALSYANLASDITTGQEFRKSSVTVEDVIRLAMLKQQKQK